MIMESAVEKESQIPAHGTAIANKELDDGGQFMSLETFASPPPNTHV